MAKKSAKSKGFRKQTAKKPYLSKRDIAILCVLVVAIAIAAFFLFRYDDGALKVKDGAVVADGDNWLIVNGAGTRGGVRYFKLGEMGEIDGYAREASSISTDANIPEYVFTPEADASVDTVTVTTSHTASEALARYAASMLGGFEGNEVGEIQSAELSGRDAHYFFYTVSPSEDADAEDDHDHAAEGADAETAEEPAEDAAEAEDADTEVSEETNVEDAKPYRKALSGYFDAAHDSCIVIHVERGADDPEAYPSDEDMIAALEKAIAAVTLESTEK